MAVKTRDFSVYPVRITGAASSEYAKVMHQGVIAVGRSVSIQRQGEKTWQRATVTERPDGLDGCGSTVRLNVKGGE